MVKKSLMFIMVMMLLANMAFGQGRKFYHIYFVDEFGDAKTSITSVTVYTSAGGTATLYTTEHDSTECGSSGVITSGLSDGAIEFWYEDTTIDLSATDGIYTRTINDMSILTNHIQWPSYLVATSSTSYAASSTITMGDLGDWVFQVANAGALTLTPANDDSSVAIGATSYTSDLVLYGASGYNLMWDASEYSLEFLDNAKFSIGTGKDFTIDHNGTSTQIKGAFIIRNDVTFEGTYDVVWCDSTYTLEFEDNAILGLGTGSSTITSDITFTYDGTDLLMEAEAADDLWKIGYTTNFDIKIYGDTNTDMIWFDTSAELMDFNGFDIRMDDGDFIKFGDDSDWTIDCSTTKILDIVPATDDETSAIYIGANEAGADLKIFGATTGEYWSYDASADSVIANTGNVLYTMTDAEVDQFKIDATGTASGAAINFETTNGGILLNADGASNGDITIDSADDMFRIVGGDMNDTAAGAYYLNVTGNITEVVSGTHTIKGVFYPDSRYTLTKSANFSITDVNECGALILVDTNEVTITLPAVATGLEYTIMNVMADGTGRLHLDPNDGDKLLGGCGFSAFSDNEKLTNTTATAHKGDYVTVRYGSEHGWYIVVLNGTWANGG